MSSVRVNSDYVSTGNLLCNLKLSQLFNPFCIQYLVRLFLRNLWYLELLRVSGLPSPLSTLLCANLNCSTFEVVDSIDRKEESACQLQVEKLVWSEFSVRRSNEIQDEG